ncbi:hypothetical protein ACH4E7_31450 [Kitasatospora sp. NPDC018058]|uniref:hypothetical protein n=1 Tax=Kitasatospora sp. NPDC018058 TaxID=3364025 RepID=UPI0037BF54EC
MLLSSRKSACTVAVALAVSCGVLAGSAHASTGSAPAAGATASAPAAADRVADDPSAWIRESQLPMLADAATPSDWRWG